MLRISSHISKALAPDKPAPREARFLSSGAPIVIWNLTRNCNLSCVHCYASAKTRQFSGELTHEEAMRTAEGLAEAGVKMVVLSGGEPLYREDLFQIAARLRELGVIISLSSNGTLIDDEAADKIAEAKFSYVGVSLDGLGAVHDRFRGAEGCFEQSVQGVLNVKRKGIKSGIRFTLAKMNIDDLPGVFDLVDEINADKLYLSHLVYSGRGNGLKENDLAPEETRKVMDFTLEKAAQWAHRGYGPEIVTGNNDADAAYLYMFVKEHWPEAAESLLEALKKAGGASAGIGVANIDAKGTVHPDPLMSFCHLGNVKEKSFGEIWFNNPDPVLARLRAQPRVFNGRCGDCKWLSVCGGSARVRAQTLTGDLWGSDPACYLSDKEISPSVSHALV